MKFCSLFIGSALLLGAPAVQAQVMSCIGSYCSGTTRGGQSYGLNTIGNYTSGQIGGRSVGVTHIGGYSSGTVGGQPYSANRIGGYTSGQIGGQRFSCNTIGTYTSCR